MADAPIGILGASAEIVDHAWLCRQWSRDLRLLTNGPAGFGAPEQALLTELRIPVDGTAIAKLEHYAGQLRAVIFADGRRLPFTALFLRPATEAPIAFAEALGCSREASGLITVDPRQGTNVPGVFVSGDCTTPMRALSAAMASGTMSGAAMVHELLFT